MCGVTALDVVAECPTFYGLAQNRSWSTRTGVFNRCSVCGIKFAIVVTTARQALQIFIRQVTDHFAQAWVRAEEIFANVVAVFNGVALKLAVNSRVHLVEQRT